MAKKKKLPEKQESSFKSDMVKRFKDSPLLFIGSLLILVIIVIAFVFLPAIVPEQMGSIDLTFGYYNRIPITYADGNYFYNVHQSLARQHQSNIDEFNYNFIMFQIWREAFEATVVYTGILDELNNAGFVIPSQVVDRAVAQLPEFQVNGRFSAARYRQMDNNARNALWRSVQDSLTANFYISDFVSINNSSKEGPFIASMASPQRAFDMVFFPISSYPNSEIISFAESNPSLYSTVHLSKITITSSEREARQILSGIQNGTETFEDAARNRSRDFLAENGGDMGSRMVFELISEIPNAAEREQVINMERGSLSNIISPQENTWVFFRMEEPLRSADIYDSITMERIRNHIMNNERGRVEDWVINQADDFISSVNTMDFYSAASAHGLTVNSFGPLPLNYGETPFFMPLASFNVAEISQAGQNDRFWQVGFSTPLNTPSVPLVIGGNVVVLFPTEDVLAEEAETNFIELYYSYYLEQTLMQAIRTYFMTNGKLDDRFWDVFQYFMN